MSTTRVRLSGPIYGFADFAGATPEALARLSDTAHGLAGDLQASAGAARDAAAALAEETEDECPPPSPR